MTEESPAAPRPPRRGTPSAVRSRVVAAGLSFTALFGLVTGMAVADARGAETTPVATLSPTQPGAGAPPPNEPKVVRRVIRRHLVVEAATPAGPATASRPASPTRRVTPMPPAPRPAPASSPAPVARTHGSR